MKIVLIGDADSIWIRDYVAHVIESETNSIFIVTNKNVNNKEYYKEKKITVYVYQSGEKKLLKRLYQKIVFSIDIVKKVGDIDVVHVQGLDYDLLLKSWKIWLLGKKKILTFWGSDILRASKRKLWSYYMFLLQAEHITVMTKDMQKKLKETFSENICKKVRVLDFGNPIYESINQVSVRLSVSECKAYWNIKDDKIAVAVGYNKIQEQQHVKLIEGLANISKEQLEKIVVVLHWGYGKHSGEYLQKIIRTLEKYSIEYVCIDRYLNSYETAILRLSVDIFLYGQTTDAFSGSVLEYVYAGAQLIKPNWLDYSILQKMGILYYEYEDFGEIATFVGDIFEKLEDNRADVIENGRKRLWQLNSWEAVTTDWKKLY